MDTEILRCAQDDRARLYYALLPHGDPERGYSTGIESRKAHQKITD
jgi:hypothetical protein